MNDERRHVQKRFFVEASKYVHWGVTMNRLHCEIPTGFQMKVIFRLLLEAICRTASRGSKYKFPCAFLLTSDVLAVSWASWTLRYFGFLWLHWLDSNNPQWLTESHSVFIQSAFFSSNHYQVGDFPRLDGQNRVFNKPYLVKATCTLVIWQIITFCFIDVLLSVPTPFRTGVV